MMEVKHSSSHTLNYQVLPAVCLAQYKISASIWLVVLVDYRPLVTCLSYNILHLSLFTIWRDRCLE